MEKKWFDMTYEEIRTVMPIEKRLEYREHYMRTYRTLVNSLYMSVLSVIKNKNFEFKISEKEATIKVLLKELMDEHYNAGFTRDQIIQILVDKSWKNDRKRKK